MHRALRAAAPYLGHVQVSDSNRYQPGAGHLDWPALVRTLLELDYRGWLALECRLARRPGPGPATGRHGAASRAAPAGRRVTADAGPTSVDATAGVDGADVGATRADPARTGGPADAAGLRRLAVDTLDANWEHDHTVPSRTLYPHQWSWDSAFIAIGLAQVRPDRAWRELTSLFRAQWADGRVPHIVFNPALRVGAYFPGPEMWRSADVPGAPDGGHLRPGPAAGARARRVAGVPAGARPAPRAGRAAPALPRAGRPAALPGRPAGRGRRRAGLHRAPVGVRLGQQPGAGTSRWPRCRPRRP